VAAFIERLEIAPLTLVLARRPGGGESASLRTAQRSESRIGLADLAGRQRRENTGEGIKGTGIRPSAGRILSVLTLTPTLTLTL